MEENKEQKGKTGCDMPFFKQLMPMIVAGSVVVLAALLLSNILFPKGSMISFVDGESMLPTLTDGQILYADLSQIQRGDIVVAVVPGRSGENTLIVKRVIALPGDTLTINEEGVYVNSERVEEDYLTDVAAAATYIESGRNYLILDADDYFLMGDNREISYDSRYFGPLQEADILYKQSTSPTTNTYAKLFLLVAMIAVCCCLYLTIESGMTKLLAKSVVTGDHISGDSTRNEEES